MKVITIIVPSNQCHLLIKELEADYFIFKKFDNYEIMQDFSIYIIFKKILALKYALRLIIVLKGRAKYG